MPEISVLLPVRDAAPWLAASLASLRRQTFRDFEVVAVDDGSRDGSGEILEEESRHDPRLAVFHTPPRGLPLALNTALTHARGRWIARHDADDLSHRRRFALQHTFAAAHGDVTVIGSRLRLFPRTNSGVGMRRWAAWHNALLDHPSMVAEMLIDSPLAHGTALIRRSALEAVGGWAERGWAEDLDLWLRLRDDGARFAKLREVLYGWRQHAGSATRRDPRYGLARFVELKLAALNRGLLRGERTVHLAGTGQSLDRWRDALHGSGRNVIPHSLRRPSPDAIRALARPLVLVFMARPARARWRAALADSGMRELQDFTFIA